MTRALFLLTALATGLFAQTSADFAQHFANEYRMVPNVTYLTMGGVDLKLDVYQKRNVTTPQPASHRRRANNICSPNPLP